MQQDDWYDKSIQEIQKSSMLIAELTADIEKYTKLRYLVIKDKVQTIKDTISRNMDYCLFCSYAQAVFEAKVGSKEEKKSKDNLEKFLQSENIFNNNAIKLGETSQFGLGTNAWVIYFTLYDFTFVIEIPIYQGLCIDNMSYTNEGKITLFLEKDSVRDCIRSSYRFEDIRKAFDKFLKEN